MRIVIGTLLLITVALPAFASDWKRLQDRGYSVMELDMQSISKVGNLEVATIREVFLKPARLSSGREYDARNMFLKVNCSLGSSAVYKIMYFYHGSLIHTLKVPQPQIKFQRMDMSRKFAHEICR